MPRFILRFDTVYGPRYLEYSSIVDAPVTYGMSLEEFRAYYKGRYGTEGMKELPERLERVDSTGSSVCGETLEETLVGNRAGAGETCLTVEQIRDWYCIKLGQGKKPRGRRGDR